MANENFRDVILLLETIMRYQSNTFYINMFFRSKFGKITQHIEPFNVIRLWTGTPPLISHHGFRARMKLEL